MTFSNFMWSFFVKVNFNFQWTILAFSLKLLATGCCCLCPCQSGNDRLISIQRQIISGISNLKFMSQIIRMISLKFLRTNLVFFCENYKNRCNNKRGQFDFYEYNVGVKIDFVQVKLFYLDKKVLCFEQFTSILYPIGSRKSKSRDTDQCNECRARACSVMRCSLEQRFSPHFVVAPAIV